jgi:sugar phosphate isomerase/epimerase
MKKISVLGFFVLMTIGSLSAQNKLLFPEMPGMVSFTYRNSLAKDMALTLDTLKAMGIRDMEFSNLFGKKAVEIRNMLDDRSMFCSSFGVGYPDLMDKTREVGENAKTLGAAYVRVAWIPHTGAFDLVAAKKAVEDFNKAGKMLKDEFGLIFCYHNHGYEFSAHENGTLMDYIIQNTNPEYVSFEIDILWAFFPGGNPATLIAKYPNRFKLMHMKDLRKGVAGDLTGATARENDVVLGTGQLDLPAILKAAKKSGIKHYYIEDESPAYASQVPQSIAFLKGLRY